MTISWILIQKRDEGVYPQSHGGMIFGGMRTVEKLKDVPDAPWDEYILENHGEGIYLVTAQAEDGHLMKLFGGPVLYDEAAA